MYPSAPLLLVKWTQAAFPDRWVGTDLPDNLQEIITRTGAAIRIQRSGGPRRITLDQAAIDLDIWAATLGLADDLCSEVATAWEFDMPGAVIDSGARGRAVIAKVAITSGPSERPASDSRLSRVGASANITLHSA